MKKSKYKVIVDIVSMILALAAVVTGFVLHDEVWHAHVYDDEALWGAHEAIGLVLAAIVAAHCVQHSFWFKNYSKIRSNKKRITTLLLIVGIIVVLSGIILMYGSRSEFVSHLHYIGALLFIVIATGHVIKRRKILKSLI